jgi:hypothetical protein
MNLNLHGLSLDEVVKSIKEKKNTDYCGVYELMHHNKLKNECFEEELRKKENPAVLDNYSNSQFKSLKQFFIHTRQ